MRSSLSLVTLGSLALPVAVSASTWTLTDYYDPQSFLTSDWKYFSETDPTDGLVTYQAMAAAVSLNLSYINSDNEFVMRVDTTAEQLNGRPSVRIYSNKNYTDGVYILNATHSPAGCSVWPAWWTVTSDLAEWPVGGEIDIMENANDQYTANLATLHTDTSCVVSDTNMTGVLAYSDCSSDTGCRIEMNGTNAVGETATGFNKASGGIYAMERSFGTTGKGVRVWYFDFDSIPDNLKNNATTIDTDSWGTPGADFPVTSCSSQFTEHAITFDTTLCGDWAAATYNETSCAKTYGSCSSQVAYNGSSYSQAYWAINSVRVFASDGGTAAASTTASSSSSSSSTSSSKGSSRSPTLVSAALAVYALGSVAAWTLWA